MLSNRQTKTPAGVFQTEENMQNNENQIKTVTAFVDSDGYVVLDGKQYNPYAMDEAYFASAAYELTLQGYTLDAKFKDEDDAANDEDNENLTNFMTQAELVVLGEWPSIQETELGIDSDEVDTFRDVNAAITEGIYVPSAHCAAQFAGIDFDDEVSVAAHRTQILEYHFPQMAYARRAGKITESMQQHLENVTESATL